MRTIRQLALIVTLLCITYTLEAQNKLDALHRYKLGDFTSAVEICEAELLSNTRNMDSYAVLCWSLIGLGRYDEASRQANKAREINRYDPRIVEVLGEACYYQGRNEEALKLFNEYVTLAPEGGRIEVVYHFMGEIYLRLGRFKHADIAFSTAVRYRPDDAKWWARLAYVRERSGDTRYSAVAYERALELDPQMTDAQRGLERLNLLKTR